MRVGIFGGTFDPPHLGHLILASEALDQLRLDRLLWMVTAVPPHKKNDDISPLEQRLALTHAAINGFSQFELSTLEINRPGPHYAVDTVSLVKKHFPQAEVFYLMGGDSLRDLPTWYESEHFMELCDGLGVMRRPGSEVTLELLKNSYPTILDKVHWFVTPLVDISSHDIRLRIQSGKPYRFFLPDAVYRLIEERQYYR